MTKLTGLSILLIVCGGILLLAALLWARLRDPRSYWNPDEAKAMAEAGSTYHAQACEMSHDHDDAHSQAAREAFDKAKQQYEQQRLAFEQARERFERPLRIMRWSGTICFLGGVLVYWVAKNADGG